MEEQNNNHMEAEQKTPRQERSSSRMVYAGALIVGLVVLGVAFYIVGPNKNAQSLSGDEVVDTTPVAAVNGETINASNLNMSIRQITATAEAQGVDVSTPEAQTEIQARALDVLINTELLLQEAENRDITVTNETINTRLNQITTELGGEEALQARLTELAIDASTLRTDIENELIIQILLDEVFAEENITVTDDEIAEAYELAGGDASGVALEEAQEQLRFNVQTAKEQAVLDAFLQELRAEAEIETEV